MRKMRTRKQRRERWKKGIHAQATKMRNEPTRCEKKLWLALNKIAAHEGWALESQVVIGSYIVDILIANKGVIIEVDGIGHERKKEYDEQRDETLFAQGYRTIRIKNTEVLKDVSACVAKVKQFT